MMRRSRRQLSQSIIVSSMTCFPPCAHATRNNSKLVLRRVSMRRPLSQSAASNQWITIRGWNRDNPVLLFLHGGPGDVTNPWTFALFCLLGKAFPVVQWDQRGGGPNAAEKLGAADGIRQLRFRGWCPGWSRAVGVTMRKRLGPRTRSHHRGPFLWFDRRPPANGTRQETHDLFLRLRVAALARSRATQRVSCSPMKELLKKARATA
mgnify:CR=1 FL=1